MQKNQFRKQLLSIMKLYLVQKKIEISKENWKGWVLEYLVKWLTYPNKKSSYEPEHHILDRRPIDKYLQSQK